MTSAAPIIRDTSQCSKELSDKDPDRIQIHMTPYVSHFAIFGDYAGHELRPKTLLSWYKISLFFGSLL